MKISLSLSATLCQSILFQRVQTRTLQRVWTCNFVWFFIRSSVISETKWHIQPVFSFVPTSFHYRRRWSRQEGVLIQVYPQLNGWIIARSTRATSSRTDKSRPRTDAEGHGDTAGQGRTQLAKDASSRPRTDAAGHGRTHTRTAARLGIPTADSVASIVVHHSFCSPINDCLYICLRCRYLAPSHSLGVNI